ncbi:IS629 ORF2 [Shigella sonnei]|nr:IS629 ORF2 [Shigella sonnei]
MNTVLSVQGASAPVEKKSFFSKFTRLNMLRLVRAVIPVAVLMMLFPELAMAAGKGDLTTFVLDALEQALWARRPSGTVHHSDKGSQYVSLAYTQRLKEAGLLASTGSTGDSYDNAMAESINGLYKAEVIHRKSWKNRAEVELATLTWVDWYNNRRLLERLGHTPPAEAEKAYYASIGNDDLAA